MVSKKVVVTNKTGLHARPASNLVAFCKNYNSKIFLSNGEKKVSAASIIHVLTPVSYTHLDVYKRQAKARGRLGAG